MKRNKMSLANITERLSRAEMKKILAGDADPPPYGCVYRILTMEFCMVDEGCQFLDGKPGTCRSGGSKCYCATGGPA